jgi:hypothetical protein
MASTPSGGKAVGVQRLFATMIADADALGASTRAGFDLPHSPITDLLARHSTGATLNANRPGGRHSESAEPIMRKRTIVSNRVV